MLEEEEWSNNKELSAAVSSVRVLFYAYVSISAF